MSLCFCFPISLVGNLQCISDTQWGQCSRTDENNRGTKQTHNRNKTVQLNNYFLFQVKDQQMGFSTWHWYPSCWHNFADPLVDWGEEEGAHDPKVSQNTVAPTSHLSWRTVMSVCFDSLPPSFVSRHGKEYYYCQLLSMAHLLLPAVVKAAERGRLEKTLSIIKI